MGVDIKLELQRYSNMHNDDLSEVIKSLLHLGNREYCLSDDFVKALDIELQNQFDNYEEHAMVVKRTVQPLSYELEELEWL